MFVPAASRSAAFFNAKRRRSSNNCGPNSSKPKHLNIRIHTFVPGDLSSA
uniref:Uncharacterized protein n=1 Tax=Meloidogyne enterolobii TaxID=390850 RepID=A0A6V7WNK8_MELEN|nr:unnamed protein product [Meloidogyne enterolobii]